MAKEIMIPILKAVGVTEWLNAGFKGQGIRVWNIESDYNHGANSRQMVIDVAPEVEMYSNSFSFSADSNKLLSEPKTECC